MDGNTGDIEVVPATIDRWEAICALFSTSPGVTGCWCMWPRRPAMTHRPDGAINKADMQALLVAGESPGLLAVAGRRTVGWCATGPRDRYPQYQVAASALTWAIPCIYIERTANRKVVARALIETAVELAAQSGAAAVDGPPPWWLPGDSAAVAEACATFLDNGFAEIRTGARMPELRRMLSER